MDITKAITHLSLCSGYGGIDLGLKRVLPALRTIAYVEIEAFAIANLVAKMEAGELDAAPIWSNLKDCEWAIFRDRVDIISGGYPCQPFSAAGQRKGDEDPRHLWPFIQGAIGIIRPRYCFFENVEGHLTLGFKDVCHDLGELGYELTAGLFSAAECGAPHQRKRVFILARRLGDSKGIGLGRCKQGESGRGRNGSRPVEGASASELADTDECGGEQDSRSGELRASGVEQSPRHRWPSRPGEAQQEWEEPRVVGDTDSGREPQPEGNQQEGGRRDSDPSAELADTGHSESSRREQAQEGGEGQPCGESAPQDCGDGELADTTGGRCEQRQPQRQAEGNAGNKDQQGNRHEAQPVMGGATDGPTSGVDATANRVDRLRLLGNGVVPATAALAFKTLYNELYD